MIRDNVKNEIQIVTKNKASSFYLLHRNQDWMQFHPKTSNAFAAVLLTTITTATVLVEMKECYVFCVSARNNSIGMSLLCWRKLFLCQWSTHFYCHSRTIKWSTQRSYAVTGIPWGLHPDRMWFWYYCYI